jgi:hypothetical protein
MREELPGLEVSLKAEPERVCDSEPERLDLLVLPKALWKKGRRVGMHAATITTFCSILQEVRIGFYYR